MLLLPFRHFCPKPINKRFYKCTSSTVINNVAKAAARLYKDKTFLEYP